MLRRIAGIRGSAVAAHRMAVDVEHNLIDTIRRLTAALVHAAHLPHHDIDAHAR